MTDTVFEALEEWFENYTKSYLSQYPQLVRNLNLKVKHSREVCKIIQQIGKQAELDDAQLQIARLAGLFHDIGRFEQYCTYNTFSDNQSVDHAQLGAEILGQADPFQQLSRENQESLLCSIRQHNKMSLSDHIPSHTLSLCRMLRDADKIDIYRIVTTHYTRQDKNSKLLLDLPDAPTINPYCMDAIRSRKMIEKEKLQTVNDFKLLQISWIFDINYKESLRIIQDKRYLETIFDTLPETPEKKQLEEIIQTEIKTRISAN